MLRVRWSPPPLALLSIALFVLDSYNGSRISQLPLPKNHMGLFKPYSFLFR